MQDHPSSSMSPSNTHNSETWKAYWKEQGQPWRTEPAIDEERQQRLLSYYQGVADIERGMYPFKGVRLSRADVEWLLAMEEQGNAEESKRGSKGGKQQKSFGLDVRGVDLSQVNLSDLPLMCLHAGLSLEEGRHATVEQSRAAAANLAKADVSNAQLQGAQLSWVMLDEAVLVESHLEGANLGKASLKGAARTAFREAAQIIQGLAEGIRDETLRSRFLAGPQIHPVLQHAQRLATSLPDDHAEPGGL